MSDNKTFTVTEDHIKLLPHMNVGWNDLEFGAPTIDSKRPYGREDVVDDICFYLDWEKPYDDNGEYVIGGITTESKARYLHAQMDTVLKILLKLVSDNQIIEPGVYYQQLPRGRWWKAS